MKYDFEINSHNARTDKSNVLNFNIQTRRKLCPILFPAYVRIYRAFYKHNISDEQRTNHNCKIKCNLIDGDIITNCLTKMNNHNIVVIKDTEWKPTLNVSFIEIKITDENDNDIELQGDIAFVLELIDRI